MLLYCDQDHKHFYEYLYHPYEPYSPHNSKHFLDIYTLTHVFWPLVGIGLSKIFFGKNIKVMIFLIAMSIWFEIHENKPEQIKKYHRIEKDSSGESSYRGDTLINILGDILINVLTIVIGYQMSLSRIFIGLIISFALITKTVGLEYWKEFISFIYV